MEFISKFFNLDFFKNLPFGWQVVFAILITFFGWFTFMLRSKNFRILISDGLKKIFHFLNEKELLMHSLFFNKRYYTNQLNNINFESHPKTKLFRFLLSEVIKSSIELPYNWIKDNAVKKQTLIQLKNSLDDLVHRIIKDYEENTKAVFQQEYGKTKGEKLFTLIYYSDMGFKKYHQARLEFIFENIDRVVQSSAKNVTDSIRTILTQIDISTDLAILDCEVAFRELNGRIEKTVESN